MTPLPKRKYAKSRQGMRRSHLAIKMPHFVDCPDCKSPRLAHRACPICGKYRTRTVLEMPSDDQ